MAKTIILTLSKSTKGTHVYANEALGINGIYIPKALLMATPAPTITLTLPGESELVTGAMTEDQL